MHSTVRAILKGTLIAGVILLLYAAYMAYLQRTDDGSGAPPVQSSGQALVGGAFQMTGSDGKSYSDADFRGQFMLIYFGYSFCPDVCPLDLQRMTMSLDLLENDGIDISSLQPLFVTIDPARDTPEVMAEYLTHFHPAILGLSGTEKQLADMASAYRVYYQRGEVFDDGSYLMDHSSIFYLMGPDGVFIKHFSSSDSPKDIAPVIARHLP